MDAKALRLVGIGAVVVVAGVGLYLVKRPSGGTNGKVAGSDLPITKPARRAREVAPQLAETGVLFPLRAFDREVLAVAAKGFPEPVNAKRDALPGSAANVTLNKDTPTAEGRVKMARIDLDRDKKIDENWTFYEDGKVERNVFIQGTPYSDKFFLQGDKWMLSRGLGATALMEPRIRPVITVALRPVDKEILDLASKDGKSALETRNVGSTTVKLVRGRQKKVSRADVDLDGDGKVDEHWSFAGRVRRAVAPDGTGRFTEQYELEDNRWVRQY